MDGSSGDREPLEATGEGERERERKGSGGGGGAAVGCVAFACATRAKAYDGGVSVANERAHNSPWAGGKLRKACEAC